MQLELAPVPCIILLATRTTKTMTVLMILMIPEMMDKKSLTFLNLKGHFLVIDCDKTFQCILLVMV